MNMATVGLPAIPNASAQASHFFMHLCDKLFGQYQAKLLNYGRDNLCVFPATVQTVLDGCRSHIVLPTMMNNMHAGNIVQQIAYGLTVEQAQHSCSNCKKFEHWARECQEPDSRKSNNDKKVSANDGKANKDKPAASNKEEVC